MAAQPKPDLAEDAHFRIDDLARDHADTKKALGGMHAAILAVVRHEIDKQVKEAVSAAIDKYKAEDRAEDRKMISEMIAQAMKRDASGESDEVEVTKRGTVETPTGTHKINVTEIHKRKPRK